MGKHELEPLIQEEIREFLDKISKDENRPFDFAPLIHFAVTNIIVSIVFGQRYDYGNEEFASLVKTLTESVQANIRVTSTRNIPFITWLPGDVSGRKRGRRASENLRNFMKDAVQEHKHRLDRENPVDFIDQYLVKIEEEKGDRNTTFTGQILHLFFLFDRSKNQSFECDSASQVRRASQACPTDYMGHAWPCHSCLLN